MEALIGLSWKPFRMRSSAFRHGALTLGVSIPVAASVSGIGSTDVVE